MFLYISGNINILFLQTFSGHVSVIVGKERMLFDGGPFSYYGVEALTSK